MDHPPVDREVTAALLKAVTAALPKAVTTSSSRAVTRLGRSALTTPPERGWAATIAAALGERGLCRLTVFV